MLLECLLSKLIAVFGVGPGLGQAVARRYAQDGYEVVLVARRREPLELFARELAEKAAGFAAEVERLHVLDRHDGEACAACRGRNAVAGEAA